jgi:hypothetical protein
MTPVGSTRVELSRVGRPAGPRDPVRTHLWQPSPAWWDGAATPGPRSVTSGILQTAGQGDPVHTAALHRPATVTLSAWRVVGRPAKVTLSRDQNSTCVVSGARQKPRHNCAQSRRMKATRKGTSQSFLRLTTERNGGVTLSDPGWPDLLPATQAWQVCLSAPPGDLRAIRAHARVEGPWGPSVGPVTDDR